MWIACVLTSLALSASPTPEEGTGPTRVRSIEVFGEETFPGVVYPRHEVTLRSSLDTMLMEIRIEEGERVSKGQIVAVLDDRVAQASVRAAAQEASRTADIDRATSALTQAQVELRRVLDARARGSATEAEEVDAQHAAAIAGADLERAREAAAQAGLQLDLARARLEERRLRAPFDGIALRVHTTDGAMLNAGDPVVEIVSTTAMCVDLHLPAPSASRLEVGSRYALELDEPPGGMAVGRVRYIEPRVDPVARTVRVVFDFEAGGTMPLTGVLVQPGDAAALDSFASVMASAMESVLGRSRQGRVPRGDAARVREIE